METIMVKFMKECDKYFITCINYLLADKKRNAIKPGDEDFDKLFCEQPNDRKMTVLTGILSKDEIDWFRHVLLLMEDIDIRFSNDSFLRIAIRNKAGKMIKYLLEQGLDVCAEDNFAIKCACMYMNSSMINYVRLLIDYGADFRTDNDFPICCAAYGCRWDTIKLLVDLGCDINANDGYVIGKIIFAKRHKMLQYAADIGGDLTNSKFVKAAVFVKSHKCLKILMDCGADVSTISPDDMITVIKSGHSKIIELLINAGVNFSLVNKYQTTKKSQKTTKNLVLLTGAGVDPVTICHIWSESNNSYGTSSGDSSDEDSSDEDWFSEMNTFSD